MSQAKLSGLELKVALVMTSQLDLSMTRAMISQLDLDMALVVGSNLVPRTSGLAIRAILVIFGRPHVWQRRRICEDESGEVTQRGKGGKWTGRAANSRPVKLVFKHSS